MLDTPALGALAELRFQQRCVERGIDCFAPVIGGHQAIDFVLHLDGRFVSVQVKKATISQNWGPTPRLAACLHGSQKRKYKETGADYRADFYAFVCYELNTVWLVPSSDLQVKQTWSIKADRLSDLDPYLF